MMFADTKLEMLNAADLSLLKTIDADMQPFNKSLSFEDGYTLELTHRAFCEKEDGMEIGGYIRIEEQIYIILDWKAWSDYLELFLYPCKSDFTLR